MPKRFTDTEIWNEDWFLRLRKDERLFFKFICDECDHAGFWKPNWIRVRHMGLKIHRTRFLQKLNAIQSTGKPPRILVMQNGRWWITGFVKFQYGSNLNMQSSVHKSLILILLGAGVLKDAEKYGFCVKGFDKALLTPKDKDMDKDKDKAVIRGEPLLTRDVSEILDPLERKFTAWKR